MKYKPDDIFTPQGVLNEVEKNPNLDFLMNVFNIPRAFGVSGFGGNWDVGKHSYAVCLIALFWAKFNNFPEEKRDRLVTLALTHDLHEAVTGDILPMFKTKDVKKSLNKIQTSIQKALEIKQDKLLEVDLKVVDLIAFLYEIKQVSPSIMNSKKLALANTIADKQKKILLDYCKENEIKKSKIQKFLKKIDL